jgi:signal transduction histidine kinase
VPPLHCNSDQIRILLMSLLISAAQPEIAGTTVVLEARSVQDGLVIEVRTRGPLVRRIANRFFSLRPGSSSIGLASAQDIVRRHGGTITGKANLGKGLEFSVWLPLHQNHTNGGREDSDRGGRREP